MDYTHWFVGFGYKVGIVDVICQLKVPCSAEDISEKGNYILRYVQEWLGCMVASGILKVGKDDKYWCPIDIETFRRNAFMASSLHLCSNRINDLQKVYQKNGPTGYTYPREIHEFMDKLRTQRFQSTWMESAIKPVMDLVNKKLNFA